MQKISLCGKRTIKIALSPGLIFTTHYFWLSFGGRGEQANRESVWGVCMRGDRPIIEQEVFGKKMRRAQ